jgi:epoxyqueuosine reductase
MRTSKGWINGFFIRKVIDKMSSPSIETIGPDSAGEILREWVGAQGFSRVRILVPFRPDPGDDDRVWKKGYSEGAPALLVAAFPYGNDAGPAAAPANGPVARLDRFSRRNYYEEATARLQRIAADARAAFGGVKSDYRILCNSPVPEKPLAEACGLGRIGRNTLVITPEAGSLVVIAAMTIPFAPRGDAPETGEADPCRACSACVSACPTGALSATERRLDRTRCIQWFASRPGNVPADIAAAWGDRLYGCSVCRDVCPHNRKVGPGVQIDRGTLPEYFDALAIARASDEEILALFKGTTLGMRRLGPAAIRRNARLAAGSAVATP